MNLGYGKQWIFPEDEAAVLDALRSEWLTQGPKVDQFEEALAEKVGARYAVAVSNGTAALHLAYLACGLGSGDVAATSPISFLATANAMIYCGAMPEFIDINPKTISLSLDLLEEKLKEGVQPKLVVPVHYAGLPCDMGRLGNLADKFGFKVIEDACHALGARYRLDAAWNPVGNCKASAATVFSFHPVKHITTGEGGAIVTNDPKIADAARKLRSHGIVKDRFEIPGQALGPNREERPWYYEMDSLGFNYRITDLQCSLGLSQLGHLDRFVNARKALAQSYEERLKEFAGALLAALPMETEAGQSSCHLYPIRIKRQRDRVFLKLKSMGINSQVHYIPITLQPYYRKECGAGPGDCPEAERYFEETLSLPLFPQMTTTEMDHVIESLRKSLSRDT